MSSIDSVLNFTDADLKASMRRAMRLTAILAAAGFVVLSVAIGWQTGVLLLAGAVVSFTGLYEWQQLIGVINAKLDQQHHPSDMDLSAGDPQQQTPRSTGFVLAMFFLRMSIAALIIYASLRFLNGSFYALLAGLGLAIVALTVETLRMLRS